MRLLFSLLTVVLMLSGCTSSEEEKKYTPEAAKENGDVVARGVVGNIEKLDTFISAVEKKEKGEVRITQFSIEGDPIFIYLKSENGKIEVTRDFSMDKLGSGEIKTANCTKIAKEEANNGTRYYLDGCDKYVGVGNAQVQSVHVPL